MEVEFCSTPTLFETADQYGQIRLRLKAKGRPIPENDIWIAATALRYGLALVTRDDHFQEVDNLNLVRW
jgi:tRNA(fMet)-specific endonuclease VapC